MPSDEGTPPANPQLPGKREHTKGVCRFQRRTIVKHEYLTNVHCVSHVCSRVSEGVCVCECTCVWVRVHSMWMNVEDRAPPWLSFLRNHPPYICFNLYTFLYLLWVYETGNIHVTLAWMLRLIQVSLFSPSTIWVLGKDLRSLFLGGKFLCPLSHLSGPPTICSGARSLTGTWDSLLLGESGCPMNPRYLISASAGLEATSVLVHCFGFWFLFLDGFWGPNSGPCICPTST